MSWSVVTEDGTKEQLPELIDAMKLGEYVTYAREEAEQQLDAAKQAAKDLLVAATLGVPGSLLRVGISGHSNPGHAPEPNFAHEMISVVVYEIAQPAVRVDEDVTSGKSDNELAAEAAAAEPAEPAQE